MFNRILYKDRAKLVLSGNGNYWYAFAVTTVTAFAVNMFSSVSRVLNDGTAQYVDLVDRLQRGGSLGQFTKSPVSLISEMFSSLLNLGTVLFLALSVLFVFFAVAPLSVGRARFFLSMRRDQRSLYDLLFAFRNGYLNVVAVNIVTDLIVFLWSLLFIVPGIYFRYAYSLVPYLLAENPMLEPSKARELSKKITDGHKWNIFVLGLSFIGWYLLGVLCCCIGTYFVEPYKEAAFAEMYISLRDEAISRGKITYSEIVA